MLRLSDDPTPFRITGLDPGTDTLGVSTLDLDLATKAISIVDSQTLLGSRLSRGNQRVTDLYGGRFTRLQALEGALGEYFYEMQPHEIISESPYFNKRQPSAYGALVEAMGMIKRAVYMYCSSITLLTVDPASNKANLKVSGKSGDKSLVLNAVRGLVDSGQLLNPYGLMIGLLDEHSIDSLAIAYYRACHIRSQLL
jgi:Holliday junction resolvasome RuvABC endonuclease subunit